MENKANYKYAINIANIFQAQRGKWYSRNESKLKKIGSWFKMIQILPLTIAYLECFHNVYITDGAKTDLLTHGLWNI